MNNIRFKEIANRVSKVSPPFRVIEVGSGTGIETQDQTAKINFIFDAAKESDEALLALWANAPDDLKFLLEFGKQKDEQLGNVIYASFVMQEALTQYISELTAYVDVLEAEIQSLKSPQEEDSRTVGEK